MNLSQFTDFHQIMLYRAGFKLTTLVLQLIGTDCPSSCKSNYHTITTMSPIKELTDTKNIG